MNEIRRIKREDGTWTEQGEEIKRVCEVYFKKAFQTEGSIGMEDQLEGIHTVIEQMRL